MSAAQGFGTKKVGYVEAEYGPFRCGRCAWFVDSLSGCTNPEVLTDTQVPQHDDKALRYAKVESGACCNNWTPEGK